MKCILIIALAALTAGAANYLHTVETMTANEIRTLRACEERVREAQAELDAVKAAIARAHGLRAEYWPEWSTTVETDGDFLLLRFNDHMTPDSPWQWRMK